MIIKMMQVNEAIITADSIQYIIPFSVEDAGCVGLLDGDDGCVIGSTVGLSHMSRLSLDSACT